jgi:uncharacterized protein YbbC (DUF1343 family)/CubicO group peptidase (beta-lactamase class C family)
MIKSVIKEFLPPLLILLALLTGFVPAGNAQPSAAQQPLRAVDLEPIDGLVRAQLRAGKFPGAVVLVGSGDRIVYRKAFGHRATEPTLLPMQADTIFDLASLTKVIATTTAIMQLVERGQLRLDDTIAHYWPDFAANGKGEITVRQALTHYSGLRADLPLNTNWSGYQTALDLIAAERPVRTPGSGYEYSDINFEILGELVRRSAGQPLDLFCRANIFEPLGMRDTGFRPPTELHDRIAPTVYWRKKVIWGQVNDPTAFRMGGVAGHAGLFSTADDLARFARMLLNGGSGNAAILQPASVARMTSPRAEPGQARQRGFGWDLEAPPGNRNNILVPTGFYGHTGYTGTSLWIDPVTATYVIILTNRVYPNDSGDVIALRNGIADTVTAALAVPGAMQGAPRVVAAPAAALARPVKSGLDVIAAQQFAPLKGLRVGLIANHSSRDAQGRRAIDLLRAAPGVQLTAIFSPEHGLDGKLDQKIASGTEAGTGLPVYSLYGKALKPTPEMLRNVDALVFDIQDAGVRFYTYISTMGYGMEAAAAAGIPFYVLDRPNPITADRVEGPMLDASIRSFTAYFPLPVRYGMTSGELAGLFNTENRIGARLHVIPMEGYNRAVWYDQTGLQWVNPSPNLRSLTQTALYPGVAMIEGANVSVGRGTTAPFELFGAPWIDSHRLASYLKERDIPGVAFEPATFTPAEGPYRRQSCRGVKIALRDRNTLDAPALGVEIASALHTLYPEQFKLGDTLGMVGARSVLRAIWAGEDPRIIRANWQNHLWDFQQLRAKYLLY